MSDASLTNLQMVRPKGPKIFLGVMGLGVIAGAAWYFTRPPGPVGEPEDPGKILVVGKDAGDTAATLKDFGFSTDHGSYEDLAAQGAAQAKGKEGIEAILHLADLRGYGYVALEDPSAHGIAGITVTADSADVKADHTWAVFSVGELGTPPKVTVDIEQSVLPLPAYVQVLRAAFKQARLANTLFAESRLPMDAVELHDQIKTAVDLHGAYAMIDQRIDKEVRTRTEALVDAEEAKTKPAILAGPMENTEVLALGDGTILSFTQGWRLDSPRDPEVTLQPSAEIELWYYPPGSTDAAERKRCKSLRGGLMALGGTKHVASPAADALLLESTGGLELWSLDVKAGACAFSRKGKVPRPEGYEHSWGAPHASGRVLRPATPPEGMAVAVWTPGQDRPEMIPTPGCTTIGDPVWLDGEHFAVSCRFEPPADAAYDPYEYDDDPEAYDPYDGDDGDDEVDEVDAQDNEDADGTEPPPPPEQTWIYVVRLSDQRIVAVPGTALGDHTGLYGLRPIPTAKGLDLIAAHPWADKLHHVEGQGDLAALFAGVEETFTALAEADAAAAEDPTEAQAQQAAPAGTPEPPAQAPPPTEGEPSPEAAEPEPEAPLLRPAFVPAGSAVVALAPESLKVSTVELPASVQSFSLSPDGARLIYVTADGGHSVRVLTLADGASTTVAENPEAIHYDARFAADGKSVVFTSSYDGTDRTEEVGRWATVGGG